MREEGNDLAGRTFSMDDISCWGATTLDPSACVALFKAAVSCLCTKALASLSEEHLAEHF